MTFLGIQKLRTFFKEWRAMCEFNSQAQSFREMVFYSEGAGDWPHLGPIIECLLGDYDKQISYLTSDPADPGLHIRNPKFRSFLIGFGMVRTLTFREIDCKHFVMTLPDLETFHLKRSVHNVHYIYLFHSINSTHLVYRKGAYDAYDTILCVGPHHVDEIRKTEAAYGLKQKELIEHGSSKLDTILEQFNGLAAPLRTDSAPNGHGNDRFPHPNPLPEGEGANESLRELLITVLIAPSWGESSLIEQAVGVELIDTLIRGGYQIILRLHPMTVRRFPNLAPSLKEKYRNEPLFKIEEDMNSTQSWLRSTIMISDWSGAAMEYSFSLQKPVIFINTQQKINNLEWQKIGAKSLEDVIRFEIGHVVALSDIATVPALIDECCRHPEVMSERILAARNKWVFNIGHSKQAAAEYLMSL